MTIIENVFKRDFEKDYNIMSDNSMVSAIIIFLNEERFLKEAIESVFNQTYENWELLLVDDGSADRSTEIALHYSEQYPGKIHYLEHYGHKNGGMSASRNLGVHNAKGKYISFLDGDDVWLPHKLERQVIILESQPEAAMVYAPLQVWYSWTGNPEDLHRDHLYGVGASSAHPHSNTLVRPPYLLSLFLRDENFIPGGVMVKREIIKNLGGYEEIFHGNYEDAVFLVKVCLLSTVFVSNECWYRYRIHPDSCSRVTERAGKFDATRLFFLNWVKNYLTEQGVKDPDVWQAIRHALRPYRHPRLHRLLKCYRYLIRQIQKPIIHIGRRTLPVSLRNWLWDRWPRYCRNLIN